MYRPRIIPVMLLKGEGLTKTIKFKNERYIGDPINAVKIFNDLRADELVFLDILASKEKRTISLDLIREVGEEANMPFAAGGGIKSIQNIKEIINAGAEKVIINTAACLNIDFIEKASNEFGKSTIVVCIDIKKSKFGKYKILNLPRTHPLKNNPIEFAKLIELKGAGEIIVQSVDNDGVMKGYDYKLLKTVSDAVSIPVISLGGAGSISDFEKAINNSHVSAVGAGSLFIYHGSRRGILINYLNYEEKKHLKIQQNE